MIGADALSKALARPDGQPVDVTKIEFEVLDNGAGRWILWDGERRLHTVAITAREDLATAMQASGVMLAAMMSALTPDPGSKLSVAAAAEAAGCPAPTWYHWEKGRHLPLDRLPAIAAALRCSVRSLIPA